MSSYSKIIQKCWENIVNDSKETSWLFKKTDIEKAADDLGIKIKNLADIRYSFDSREELPISGYGILQQGKGHYAFVPVEENLISVESVDNALTCPDNIDDFTRKFITNDEQGAITRLYLSGALNHFTGFSDIIRIQDHWRTTGPQGQVEVDSLASVMINGTRQLLLINVKKTPDRISKTYLDNQYRLGKAKFDCDFSILNVYVSDSYAVCWLATNLHSLDEIAIGERIMVNLYDKAKSSGNNSVPEKQED